MALQVYNTLTRRKEPFEPVNPPKVGIYCCGPTVYMPSHVGHMVGPVVFDVIKRYLEYLGYDVTLVVNITDVEDKLIRAAAERGMSVKELAEEITEDYLENLRRLHVDNIDFMPRATENIDAIIRLIQGLIDKGVAYQANGDVYFDVTRFPEYGKLSHRDPAALEAGARIEPSPLKRHPADFALWKGAKPGEPAWDSPWGKGRPGWHIECSAMSMRYLGETFDIHGGGLDLVFPHHENEIAQSEAYTGKPFVKYWLHNGLLRLAESTRKLGARAERESEEGLDEQQALKMSKSKGNIVIVSELLKEVSPEALRFFILSTHYRRPIEFSLERVKEVERAIGAFYRFFDRYSRITGESFYELPVPRRRDEFTPTAPDEEFLQEITRLRERFFEAMDDDFNTAAAIGVLFDLLGALNRYADRHNLEGDGKQDTEKLESFKMGVRVLRELTHLLGLFLEPPKRERSTSELTEKLIKVLVDLRAQARSEKNYALADEIRRRLGELGIVLEDRPGGTVWRFAESE